MICVVILLNHLNPVWWKMYNYKVTVTKGTMESIVYWWETSYKKFMESIELLYNVAKVDAVELEMITKEEYDRNYV